MNSSMYVDRKRHAEAVYRQLLVPVHGMRHIAMVLSLAAPAAATGTGNAVRFTKSSAASSLEVLGQTAATEQSAPIHADTDLVRVSIVLEDASPLHSGFSTMNVAESAEAMAYRAELKNAQAEITAAIERKLGQKLDVVWNLTLAANLISANVRYGQIEAIRAVPGVKGVYVENEYQAIPVENENSTNMATSGSQTGSILAWAEGYTGAGTRIAVIDTGTDTNHQSLNAEAFEYALSLIAQEKGMSFEAYVESLDLLDAEEIAAAADELNIVDYLDADRAYVNTKLIS